MRLLPQFPPGGRLSKPVYCSRALLAVCASFIGAVSALATPSTTIVVSQVYGGGGNSGATYKNDFIELHNISSAPVSVEGWSVQYNSATGTSAYLTAPLSGTIAAGAYYLVQGAAGTGGTTNLPTPDNTSSLALSGTAGKVALVNSTSALAGASAANASGIVDFVGFGTTASVYEGAGRTPAPSNTTSVTRLDNGSTDTDNNSTDFTAGAPVPRNSGSPSYIPEAAGAPVISSLTPANGSSGAPVADPLTIVFNKKIVKGTGNITLNLSSDNSIVSTIDVTTTAVTVSNYTATITLPASLTQGVSYYVNMPAGTFKDLTNTNFAGIANNSTWTFTAYTPDITAPTVSSFTPLNGATDIAPPSTLKITFSEPVDVPVASGPLIYVKKTGGATVATIDPSKFAITTAVSVAGAVATINITPALEYGTSYYVEIDSGAFVDASSNPFAGITGSSTWAFTTVDVPGLSAAAIPYTQTFSTYTSAATLPNGWSYSGASDFVSDYRATWGTVTPDPLNALATLGGFLGNASVFGYHHTSTSNTTSPGLVQTLTLRNSTGAVITDLSVAYKGRMNVPANTRIPVFAVSVAGTPVTALGYSTADGDNAQRNATLTGLAIADGATFQINWSSAYPSGAGSARQIGISDVSVTAASALYSPTVALLSIPVGTIGSLNAPVQADVIGDGGQTITARGFVFSETSVNAAPVMGGTGVTTVADGAPTTGALNATLAGLTPATNYSVSAYATNLSGTSYTPVATFTSLAPPPTFVSSYTQAFDNYNGTNPAGWTAISDAVPPVQTFAGAWGTGSTTGGFLGSVTPGVLGYRHISTSGNLTVTLHLVNGSGSTLTSLNIGYKGRVNAITEGRSPVWAVSVNGGTAVAALAYSTLGNVDTDLSTTLTGLTIAPGAEFTIAWKSDRGLGSGSSKQIGIAAVSVSIPVPPYSYGSWATTNSAADGPNGDHDGDGVSNVLEYFMRATGSGFTANPGIIAGKITWPKEPGFVGTYTVQTSPDLVTWTNKTATVVGNTIEYTPAGSGKVFVRLQVVATTP